MAWGLDVEKFKFRINFWSIEKLLCRRLQNIRAKRSFEILVSWLQHCDLTFWWIWSMVGIHYWHWPFHWSMSSRNTASQWLSRSSACIRVFAAWFKRWRAECVGKKQNIILFFIVSYQWDVEVEILPNVCQEPTYRPQLINQPLMTRNCDGSGQQQAWYWRSCREGIRYNFTG